MKLVDIEYGADAKSNFLVIRNEKHHLIKVRSIDRRKSLYHIFLREKPHSHYETGETGQFSLMDTPSALMCSYINTVNC